MVIQKISKLLGMLITQIENWNISIAKLRKVHSLQIFMGVYVFDILQCLHKCLHSFHLLCFRSFSEFLVFTAFRNEQWRKYIFYRICTHANLGNRQMQMTHLLLPSLVHASEQEQWIVGVLPRYYDTQASESCHVHVIRQPADYQLLFLQTLQSLLPMQNIIWKYWMYPPMFILILLLF